MRHRRLFYQITLSLWGACSVFWSLTAVAQSTSTAPMKFYYFGGAGERDKPANMFDSGFLSVQKLSEQRNWDATFQVDTGHSATQTYISNLSDKSKSSITEFTTENFEKEIGKIIGNLEDGKFARDQQLMITIDTHGFLKTKAGENMIQTTDGSAVLSEPVQRLIKSAKRKGVKLGLVLINCYSGDIRVDLGNTDDVCIISGSSPNRLSTADFHRFLFDLGKSSNLEEAFLTSRQQQILTASQPGINTKAGFRAEQDLDIFKNYKFYAPDAAAAAMDRLCENTSFRLDRLTQIGRELEKDSQKKWYDLLTKTNGDIARELRSGILSLKNRFDRTPAQFDSGRYGLDSFECQAKNPDLLWNCVLIHFDPTSLATHKELASAYKRGRKIDPMDPRLGVLSTQMKSYEQVDKYIKNIETNLLQPEVVRGRQDVARKKFEYTEWKGSIDKLNRDAAYKKLVDHERRLYDALYKQYSKSEKESNACRDFKLK